MSIYYYINMLLYYHINMKVENSWVYAKKVEGWGNNSLTEEILKLQTSDPVIQTIRFKSTGLPVMYSFPTISGDVFSNIPRILVHLSNRNMAFRVSGSSHWELPGTHIHCNIGH